MAITRMDPLRDFKFRVEIEPIDDNLRGITAGIGQLGFAVVSGISVQNEMIPYREGGMNTHPHKMVGQSDFTPVTFSRGVFANQDQLWKWQTFMHAWMQGATTNAGSSGVLSDYRCNITVRVYDHPYTGPSGYQTDPSSPSPTVGVPGTERMAFKLYNCWPGGFALSDLNAGASSIMVQQMVVHHEGFELKFLGNDTTPSASFSI